MLGKVGTEGTRWLEAWTQSLPGGVGVRARRWLAARLAARCGQSLALATGIVVTGWSRIEFGHHVHVMRNSTLLAHSGGRIVLGDAVSLNSNVFLGASEQGSIVLGSRVLVGPNVVMRASDHRAEDPEQWIAAQGHLAGEIVVEEGTWIGANCVITRNVRIGAHSVIAAGAVVTRSVAPYSVMGGVPARLIRSRLAHAAPADTPAGPGPGPDKDC